MGANLYDDEQTLRDAFAAAGQSHVFGFWDELSPADRDALVAALRQFDVARVNEIFNRATNPTSGAAAAGGVLAPLPATAFASTIPASASVDVAGWRDKGLRLIANLEVAVILLAGGQGTRLGSSAPKGCYDVNLPSHSSLFQLQAERIRAIQIEAARATGATHDVVVPFYVMTSGPTRKATETFFKDNGFFGLREENVIFFEQGVLPAFSMDGRILLETKSSIVNAPDGNGGIYSALKREGVLDDLQKRRISYIHAYCVDNCLVKVADPVFIGHCVSKNADCGAKTVPKLQPHEPVGVICLKDNRFAVVEYSEIDKSIAEQRDASGALAYRAANIANHFYTTEFLVKAADYETRLEYHIAKKKIAHVDPTTGLKITPTSPNGIKLELFIFDVFPFTQRMAILECPRDVDFSPLKNAPGSKDGDSPETCRRDLLGLHRRWIEAVGGRVAEGVEVEIAPAVSYDGDRLEGLRGRVVKRGGYARTLDELIAMTV